MLLGPWAMGTNPWDESSARAPLGGGASYGAGVTVVYRAGDAPAASRADDWRDLVCDVIGPHEVRVPEGVDAGDRLALGEVGPVMVGEFTSGTPAWIDRSRRNILRTNDDDHLCKVQVMERGRGVVQQDGREASLGPGDLVFVDLSRPARWAMSPMGLVAVMFPRALLPLPSDDVASLTAVRVSGDRGVGRLVSSLARQLPRHLDDGPASVATATRLGTAVLDLLMVALAARADGGSPGQLPVETQRRALLVRIHAFVEEHLADPGLSPAVIAAAHHMSVRSLYKLFEGQDTTVASWIRRRRLERCRRDLLDPTQRHVPVSTVAARWGLTNAAHFSRVFRAAYGVSPVDYRRMGETGGRGENGGQDDVQGRARIVR